MVQNKTLRLVTAGLLLVLGLILPYFTAHAFGVPGTVLLPMHIPVLLCGLICGPRYGAACGLILPVLSSLLTGMPPVYPMLPMMAVQLPAMGAVGGLLYGKRRIPLYLSLLLAMVSGWVLYGLMFSALTLAGGGIRALSVTAALIQGAPGIAVQLLLIPALVAALSRYGNRTAGEARPMEDELAEARDLIKGGGVSCVVIREGAVIHTADGRGVSPLLNLYGSDPEKLRGAFVADKIVGKAAAMILVLGGASRVYGLVMSAAGLQYLQRHGVTAEYGRCVDVISNRQQNGICPIEKSVLDIDDPQMGLAKITETVKELIKQAG